ncbi:phosphonate ABC transporter ATP-binding protein [Pseudomonas asuensis]|uniref:Phosphonates import ATP-binding protein PhnC 1 n=1 Tax=Pseudomonas asuensis TaxID=1825787 RepID=A0ABQ2H104_9PSED|nr:ATP-binding cassette domain-containing protein [Pseudomonas asuensis]GGM24666.1 phosphonates import ATP-binding protein PhnC 1 [Pseudomonas asuensis]
MSVLLTGVELLHANGHRALSNLELNIAKGERVALIGSSGAGKTSLLRLLATSHKPTAGQLTVLQTNPWSPGMSRLKALRTRIGLIHQAPPLPARQRVITAVLAGRLGQWSLWKSLISLAYPLDRQGAMQALAKLDLAEKLYQRCNQLSGGQLQRVGIARVLYQAPELILADEPVSAMDPVLASHTLNILARDAESRNATLIASLHSIDLALKHFPRVIGLRQGIVAFDKATPDITPEDLEALYVNEQLALDESPKTAFIPATSRC